MKRKKRRLKQGVKLLLAGVLVLGFVFAGRTVWHFVRSRSEKTETVSVLTTPENSSVLSQTESMDLPTVSAGSGLQDYHLRNLSDEQKQAARTLVEGMKAGLEEIELENEISLTEMNELYHRLKFSDPELFFLADQQEYEFSPITKRVKKFHPRYLEFTDGLTIPERLEQVRAMRDAIIQQWHGQGEYECSVLINDYLVDNITYNPEAPNAHNLYGALVDRQAVCDGYALAYKYLADGLSMDSFVITGSAYDDEAVLVQGQEQIASMSEGKLLDWDSGYRHAWNAVCIEGQWYYTDSTYNDPVSLDQDPNADFSGLKEAFTNLSWSEMMKLRTSEITDLLIRDYPKEDHYEASVYYRNGNVITDEVQVRDWLFNELAYTSSRWVTVKVTDPVLFENMQEIASSVLNEYAVAGGDLNWDLLQSVRQEQTQVFAIYLCWN